MSFTHAITRRPGKEMAAGITTSTLGSPDYAKALDQFNAYVKALNQCGLSVTVLDPLDGYPDAHFVEDAAVVTPDLAVITNPGAASRKGEVPSIAAALQPFRKIVWVKPPGTIDGGDVLMIGRHFFIGLSDRTNEQGARQLGDAVSGFGCTWTPVPVAAGLHFKSSVNAVSTDTLLTTQSFVDHPSLAGFHRIVVSPQEEYAGNTLLVNSHLIMPAGFPDTRKKLETLGRPIIELDTSEFRKMDGGLTCLSLRF
ncbi:N(G),N(G)-dimethylarginine dimethylaminohydrolase [uncultured Desulfosarcina sp.]|uniref:dimethylarginine dimethylaminohydrolase family protein n=1 Tax=uncultured Desulfosarcina sp. TaxID=218289 RepID=UPI0029C8CCC9|nr:N(G),N(G)-dimethylarginine dimethylaminohydrolase [uncultured Desulfosarcina sp.]